jgi:hypothetical protein
MVDMKLEVVVHPLSDVESVQQCGDGQSDRELDR